MSSRQILLPMADGMSFPWPRTLTEGCRPLCIPRWCGEYPLCRWIIVHFSLPCYLYACTTERLPPLNYASPLQHLFCSCCCFVVTPVMCIFAPLHYFARLYTPEFRQYFYVFCPEHQQNFSNFLQRICSKNGGWTAMPIHFFKILPPLINDGNLDHLHMQMFDIDSFCNTRNTFILPIVW